VHWDCPYSDWLCSSGWQSGSSCAPGLASREENPSAPIARLCSERAQSRQGRFASLRSEEATAVRFWSRQKGSSTFASCLLHTLLSS